VKVNKKEEKIDEEKLFKGVLRLNSKVMGLSLGVLCGFLVFIATNWLVIKGGNRVGPHLSLLNQYFIGYRVSFLGSFIGFFYGFLVGVVGGVMIAWIYNKIINIKKY
jgi:ABC-type dipeptide/oligopeptide/nickel transport system permease subunit